MIKITLVFQVSLLIFALTILQWNAQGFNNHGRELAQYLQGTDQLFHVLCIQETWFQPENKMILPGYDCFSRHRENQARGGCALYIHNSLYYEQPIFDDDYEIQHARLRVGGELFLLVNFYNPCQKLNDNILKRLVVNIDENDKCVILGDFNSHNILWGSKINDCNGKIVDKFVMDHDLLLLNDGTGTRIDPHSGKLSSLDLSFVTPNLGSRCLWKVMPYTFRSDHFCILIQIQSFQSERHDVVIPTVSSLEGQEDEDHWSFKNMNWVAFAGKCEELLCAEMIVHDNVQKTYEMFMKYLKQAIKETLPEKNKKRKSMNRYFGGL